MIVRFISGCALFAVLWTGMALATFSEAACATDESGAADDDSGAIDALIRRLGSESFAEREEAQARLADFGFAAFDSLLLAEQDDDIEIAARARYLVRLMQVQWVQESDSAAVKHILEKYDMLEESDRLEQIRKLASLPNDEGLSALCRLVRFEKSEILSKCAAVELIGHAPPKGGDLEKRRALIVDTLARSPRPAAAWLRTYARAHEDPAEHVVQWSKVVEAEQLVLEQFPEQSRPEILLALLREQIERLDDLDRDEDALAVMHKIVQNQALVAGTDEQVKANLLELLAWLVDRKAWSVVDELATRFAKRIETDPVLLYVLADARVREGREADADELAKRALALKPENAAQHLDTAQSLRQRGQLRWAEAELRHVIDSGQMDSGTVLMGCYLLADMIYDRAEYLAAAELLDEQIKQVTERVQAAGADASAKNLLNSVRGKLSGRMHYYYAMHFHEQGNYAEEAKHLDLSLEHDKPQNRAGEFPAWDIDVLIGLHRLPEPGDERHRKTEQMIEQTASAYQQIIQREPEDATNYNQLAWLWANTDRKLKEALGLSLKSLEIKPNEAGYLDTLARCYYALGDYEKAVATQQQAVTIDPHSGQMNRQMKLFQDALDKSRSTSRKS